MINLTLNITGLDKAHNALTDLPKHIKLAQKRALQAALKAMRAEAVRQAQALYYVKAGTVRKSITLTPGTESGTFLSRGRRQSLSDFYMRPKNIPKRRLHGLDVAVRRDTGIKHLDKAFLIRGQNSGKVLPMERFGPARKNIRHLVSRAVPQMLENEQVQQAMITEGTRQFERAFRYWSTQGAAK